jgi:hypothetical protein
MAALSDMPFFRGIGTPMPRGTGAYLIIPLAAGSYQ